MLICVEAPGVPHEGLGRESREPADAPASVPPPSNSVSLSGARVSVQRCGLTTCVGRRALLIFTGRHLAESNLYLLAPSAGLENWRGEIMTLSSHLVN